MGSVISSSSRGDRSRSRFDFLEVCDLWRPMGNACLGFSVLESSAVQPPERQIVVGICSMAKKSKSKPMKEILERISLFKYITVVVFEEDVILNEPVENWPLCDCLISFHSKGFPLDKAVAYAKLRNPFVINDLNMQYLIQDRREVYSILQAEGILLPRYAILNRDPNNPKECSLIEGEDHVEVNGEVFQKPFVEKPVSAEDHNVYIYYPTSAGGGSQRLFRKIGSRSSVYSPESSVRKTGSYIYEEFMPTDGTDVKVYTVGPDYAHAEARKSPALDGKVERDSEGKEVRYPVILNAREKLIAWKVCLAFKEVLDIARQLLMELGQNNDSEIEENKSKLEQLKTVLEILHSTYRHDLKIYASDEGRVQMTAAAFAKGLLALEGELTPILVQMVKSANMNGLLDSDSDSLSSCQQRVKARLHEILQKDRDFTAEDYEKEYGITKAEKLEIAKGYCTPLVRKIRSDLQRTQDDDTVNKLHPVYSRGVLSPERHVRTRLYFTSESHVHSLLSILRYGALCNESKDEQWKRAMDYLNVVNELNYMTQIVIMLYEDPNKDLSSEERFHVELHFSPGAKGCEEDKNLPSGYGYRPASREVVSENANYLRTPRTLVEQKQNPTVGSHCAGLFSTSVLGGSSSAPNLQDYARTHRKKLTSSGCIDDATRGSAVKRFSISFARHPTNGFELYSMVPSICPLETLHNALSLKQVDDFLASIASPSSEVPRKTPEICRKLLLLFDN
ncbi:hypothetical protein CB1_000916042 [Camelus ferus]|nr:hypothetical protein CB1_000916042 [Camelus ferus]